MNTQRFQHWALYVLFYCYVFTFTALASCYYRNGTDANLLETTEVYQPCDAGDEDSMCCALNRPDADKCRSDGLCLSVFDGNIWRDSCTDRSWKSSKCIKLCDSGIGQYRVGQDRELANDTFTITPCADGSYCCGNGTIAQSCCDNNKGVFVSDGETTSKNPSATSTLASISSTSTSAASQFKTSSVTSSSLESSFTSFTAPLTSLPITSPPSSSTSASNTPSTSFKSNTGVILGGVIGGIAVLVLFIGIALILARLNQHAESKPRIPLSRRGKLWSSWRAKRPIPQGVSGISVRRELAARETQELDAGIGVRRELEARQIQELGAGRDF